MAGNFHLIYSVLMTLYHIITVFKAEFSGVIQYWTSFVSWQIGCKNYFDVLETNMSIKCVLTYLIVSDFTILHWSYGKYHSIPKTNIFKPEKAAVTL